MRKSLVLAALAGSLPAAIVGTYLAFPFVMARGAMKVMTAALCLNDTSFMAENHEAMARMMTDMDIDPSGDVDQDFAAMMIPHHRAAIEMARAELKHGRNEILRRMAQEIIVEQQQEIVAMRLALEPAAPSPKTSPSSRTSLAMRPSVPSPYEE